MLGEIAAPAADADQRQRELLSRKGDEHEQRYLAKLIANGASVEELPARVGNDESFAAAQDRTLAAIERGPAYIFQPTFFDGTFWAARTSCDVSTARARRAAGATR